MSKSDCIRLGHGPMRLVHRRNNPNKETLIYIPLSHATETQAYRIRVANHMIVITGMHNKYNTNPKQEQVIVKTGIITGIKEIMISITTGNMTGISRIITIPMTVSIINIIIIITRLTHISRYVTWCTANPHTSIYKQVEGC